MPAGTTPIFVLTPKAPQVRISTANTSRDGTGTLGTLHTCGSNGSYFRGWGYRAQQTTTAGMIRLYRQSGGTGNKELIDELAVAAVTVSASQVAANDKRYPSYGLVGAAGDVFYCSTHNGETFLVELLAGGDY